MSSIGKLKKIACVVSSALPGQSGEEHWDTELVPLHIQDGTVTASGALLNQDGRSVGVVNISGIPIHQWPKTKPLGRPKSDEKHLAVFLAWCLAANRWNEKYGEADREIADLFGYSEQKKVRDIRSCVTKKLGIDISKNSKSLFHVRDDCINETACNAAVLLKKPTWYQKGDGLEVFGDGLVWAESFGERVSAGVVKVEAERMTQPVNLDEMNKQGGR
jgi:hypothetical protein